MATGAVFPERRTDHRRPGLDRRHRALARRLRSARLVLVALFVVTLPWYVIGFWNATIGLLIMRFARDPVAAVMPVAGRVRGDEPITASTAILLCIRNEPPSGSSRDCSTPMMEAIDARGVARALPCLRAERHQQDARSPPPRAARFAALAAAMARPVARDLPAPRRQYRLQGRQYPGFLRALGQRARIRRHARRRQLHDGRRDPAQLVRIMQIDPQARHPAEPGRRHALGQRLRPHLPVRHAARHALVHHRQRLVAGRLRPVLGPQRDRRIAPFVAHCRIAGAARQARWAAMCSATTRSRRC